MGIYDEIGKVNVADLKRGFEVGGFKLIPEGTKCRALIDEVKEQAPEWYNTGESFLSVQWRILGPEEYQNRVVFQKLYIKDADAGKRVNGLTMLMAIDLIVNDGEASGDYTEFAGNILEITVGEWDYEGRKGNLVRAVKPDTWGTAGETFSADDDAGCPF